MALALDLGSMQQTLACATSSVSSNDPRKQGMCAFELVSSFELVSRQSSLQKRLALSKPASQQHLTAWASFSTIMIGLSHQVNLHVCEHGHNGNASPLP